MTTRQWVALGALVVLILLLLLLLPRRRPAPLPLTDLQVAESWLECIDCQGPFLRHLKQSSSGSDTVVRFLRAALLQGPDSARRARHELALLRAWADDSLHRARLGQALPAQSKSTFLFRYREGFEAKWRGRAAMALGVIRGDTALAALDSALLIAPTSHGDSLVLDGVKEAQADSGLKALNQWKTAQ
ncbi:MAG TPA: hypothetical protein VFN40_13635 [Gemmatimonadales bacterium]|nr:hypothetical protein [Gemmatimonadales bacterium]